MHLPFLKVKNLAMKITIEDFKNRQEGDLASCLVGSLDEQLINQLYKDGFIKVELKINGQYVEPAMYARLVKNIETYIEEEGKRLVADKLELLERIANELKNNFS